MNTPSTVLNYRTRPCFLTNQNTNSMNFQSFQNFTIGCLIIWASCNSPSHRSFDNAKTIDYRNEKKSIHKVYSSENDLNHQEQKSLTYTPKQHMEDHQNVTDLLESELLIK